MKPDIFVFVLLATITVVVSKPSREDAHERFEKLSKECSEDDGVSDDNLVEALKNSEMPEEQKFKDHIICLAKKVDVMSDEDKIDQEKLSILIDTLKGDIAELDDNVDDCKKIEEGDEPVVSAFKVFTCIYHAIEDQ